MALCPFATRKLIPPGSNDPRIVPRIAILHVDAGNAPDLYDFFKNRSGGIESHFHVAKTGSVLQYRDTNFQADANLDANDFAVSIETQGFGAGEWNDLQLASIKRLLVWLSKVHPIPLRKAPAWNGAGVGYHTLFGAPSHWTPVSKSCPGPERKIQFETVLVPWMNLITHNTGESTDMTPDEIATAPITMLSGPKNVPTRVTLQDVLRDLEGTQDAHGEQLARIEKMVAAIMEKG